YSDTVTAQNIDAHNFSVISNTTSDTIVSENLVGRRIVDIAYIFEQIKKNRHSGGTDCSFLDMIFKSEIRNGYTSSFKFQCQICSIESIIHSENPKESYIPINKSLVNGSIAAGIGYAQLTELSASVELPTMCNTTYIKMQNCINLVVQKTAWSEMQKAGNEERQMALENGEVDVDGIPMCTVIADGQWSKRSYKSKYNALSGTATIIGKRTRKVLFVGIRNRYCVVCQRASNRNEKPSEHE
ncbi:uncharacterized protein LOC132938802, partial [Metopolophium dirhodum]|uniref:uncharacterized protein LOC132938802 n=1 Tax=Metopolophium dirhodum TaxID=44670 RepID=UPI00299069C3